MKDLEKLVESTSDENWEKDFYIYTEEEIEEIVGDVAKKIEPESALVLAIEEFTEYIQAITKYKKIPWSKIAIEEEFVDVYIAIFILCRKFSVYLTENPYTTHKETIITSWDEDIAPWNNPNYFDLKPRSQEWLTHAKYISDIDRIDIIADAINTFSKILRKRPESIWSPAIYIKPIVSELKTTILIGDIELYAMDYRRLRAILYFKAKRFKERLDADFYKDGVF